MALATNVVFVFVFLECVFVATLILFSALRRVSR